MALYLGAPPVYLVINNAAALAAEDACVALLALGCLPASIKVLNYSLLAGIFLQALVDDSGGLRVSPVSFVNAQEVVSCTACILQAAIARGLPRIEREGAFRTGDALIVLGHLAWDTSSKAERKNKVVLGDCVRYRRRSNFDV